MALEQRKVLIKNGHVLKGTASHELEKGQERSTEVISGEKCLHRDVKCSWEKEDGEIWMWPRSKTWREMGIRPS